ncbi:hypothetical protein CO2235_200075 [Cupriavidus oxalaticus]|uniref:Uncharacterized protein n=1 Tax=Cupriavidus oxalaticus TaxID=96344 RepID=A0A375G8V9_9BURK|nr:hypothetical protein CO2235_200075 [Cupriavidus oxalaticus]
MITDDSIFSPHAPKVAIIDSAISPENAYLSIFCFHIVRFCRSQRIMKTLSTYSSETARIFEKNSLILNKQQKIPPLT